MAVNAPAEAVDSLERAIALDPSLAAAHHVSTVLLTAYRGPYLSRQSSSQPLVVPKYTYIIFFKIFFYRKVYADALAATGRLLQSNSARTKAKYLSPDGVSRL